MVPTSSACPTAIVTGGGRGIGRAIALRLATDGARVVIIGRNADRLRETAQLLNGGAAGTIECLPGDVRDEAFFNDLRSTAPSVQILIHGAAAFAPYALLEQTQDDELVPVWETIFTAALRLTRHVLPGMKAQRFGRILYLGSAVASLGGAGQVAYASAKAALEGLMRSVTCESAMDNIACNLLELGLVETERVKEALSSSQRRQLVSRIPAGRMGTVAEVAHVVSFLTSTGAGYIQGAVIPVTGGAGLGLTTYRAGETHADL